MSGENAVDPGVPGIEVVEGGGNAGNVTQMITLPTKMIHIEGVGRVPQDRIKEVEYYPSGAVRAVRFWGDQSKKKEAE